MAQTIERMKPKWVYTGQYTLTTSAVAIGSSADLVASEITIKATAGNVDDVFIGSHADVGGTTLTLLNGFQLRAGEFITVTAGSPSDIYAIGTAADTLSWIAS